MWLNFQVSVKWEEDQNKKHTPLIGSCTASVQFYHLKQTKKAGDVNLCNGLGGISRGPSLTEATAGTPGSPVSL